MAYFSATLPSKKLKLPRSYKTIEPLAIHTDFLWRQACDRVGYLPTAESDGKRLSFTKMNFMISVLGYHYKISS